MADSRLKQIKIKTGVVKRLAKEKAMYAKEAELEKTKLEKMKALGGDSYTIRKQEEVIRESLMMIPECHKRLQTAHSDLQNILDTESDLSEDKDFQAAVQILDETRGALASD